MGTIGIMKNARFQKPVVLCVGTVNVTGDSIGPKVGDELIAKGVDAYVYGKSARPVNGINYENYVDFIKKRHPDSIVIAVDACLGKKDDVGRIKYALAGLRAGAALQKNMTSFGDVSVLCVVAEKSDDNLMSLIRADKALVRSMAQKCAEKIFALVEDLRLNYARRNKLVSTTQQNPPSDLFDDVSLHG